MQGVITEIVPSASFDSENQESFAGWFFELAESARKTPGPETETAPLSEKGRAKVQANYLRWVIRECAPLRLQE